MIVIFAFSNRDAEQSSEDSALVGDIVCNVIVEDYQSLDETGKEEKLKSVDFAVRKTAHAMEYAILAALILGFVYESKRRHGKNFCLAWLFATLYAVTDELHQLTSDGRACRVTDVMIDSLGAFIGLALISLVIVKFYNKELQ